MKVLRHVWNILFTKLHNATLIFCHAFSITHSSQWSSIYSLIFQLFQALMRRVAFPSFDAGGKMQKDLFSLLWE